MSSPSKSPSVDYHAGDILLTSGSSLLGWLVKFVTHSRAAHAAIVVDAEHVIEAVTPRVRRAPIPHNVVAVLPAPQNGAQIAAEAVTHLGERYALAIDAAIGLRLIAHLDLPLRGIHGTICSTLAAQCWRKAGIALLPQVPARSVTPALLYGTPFCVPCAEE